MHAVALLLAVVATAPAAQREEPGVWTIYVTNDNCPDYTWGFTEKQTRQAFADVVRGHLDEMKRTDEEAPGNRDRYNMAVTQEALCFVERYPDRKDELIRRIKEGRAYVSPYLCNSLWAFQSVESALRTFYPARRLEREWGIRIDVAEHIEEPSLPWGHATILAGCGIRWLHNPFYGHDSTFRQLACPPAFIHEGPDGSQVRVLMDPWACNSASYMQGQRLLRDPKGTARGWADHYAKLGDAWPLRTCLASGTHGDINPGSGGQAHGFAQKIIACNKARGDGPMLVNATVPMFCTAVDEAQAKTPFLKTLRGSFGHAWDVWPVCLAKYAADMREGGRRFLAAEALIAVASRTKPEVVEATRRDRERAEWCWAMLSDHAWNGTSDANKRHNAGLRRAWAQELNALSLKLAHQGWTAAGLESDPGDVTVFNPLPFARSGLVRIEQPGDARAALGVPSQAVREAGNEVLYMRLPRVDGLGGLPLSAPPRYTIELPRRRARASPTQLWGGSCELTVDRAAGGITSLLWPSANVRLPAGGGGVLCQTMYHDGADHALMGVKSEVVANGAIVARLRLTGSVSGIQVTSYVTVYSKIDRVDFDIRIRKPVTRKEERLCHVFPVVPEGAVVRIETTGAVIRPYPQPKGDLLPGADRRRFAVQGFVDASLPNGPGVTIVPLDAFVLRRDLGEIVFEALGNDQNYREVVQDQHGETEFRFRYSLWVHDGPYDQAEAFRRSREVLFPLVVARGRLPAGVLGGTGIAVPPDRAIATCLKPADEGAEKGVILRVWETAGKSEPLAVAVGDYRRAVCTDLLERDLAELPVKDGKVSLPVRGHGFAGLRLLP